MRWGISLKIMRDSIDKSFNYLLVVFLKKLVVYLLGCCVVIMRLWLCVFVLDRTVSSCNMER
jgi:hypothetical protein